MNYANNGMINANIGMSVKERCHHWQNIALKFFIVFGLRLGAIKHFLAMTYANIGMSFAIFGMIYTKNTIAYANDVCYIRD